MVSHNPRQIIEQLQVILSNPAKKIGFLFGAGISTVDKDGNELIPTNRDMLETVVGNINGNEKKAVQAAKLEIGDDSLEKGDATH